MFSIMKNICKVLFKRKGFLITTFVLPIVLVNFFLSMGSSNIYFPVAVINNDKGKIGDDIENRLKDIEGIEIHEIDDSDNYLQKLSFHNYEMVIILDEDCTKRVLNGDNDAVGMYSINQSDYKAIVQNCIEDEVKSISTIAANVEVTDSNIQGILDEYKDNRPDLTYSAKEKRTNVKGAFGMVLYILALSSSMVCEYTLEDERNNTKSRILMSKVSEKVYLGAQCITYFMLSAIPALEYFVICKMGNYDIGFENDYLLLVILFGAVLLGVVFNMLLSSLIKKKQAYNMGSATALVPVFMLSGAFWPYELMGDTLQKVGNILPPRWLIVALDNLQKGEGFESIIPMMSAVLLTSCALFLLSIFFTRNKIVLVKDKN